MKCTGRRKKTSLMSLVLVIILFLPFIGPDEGAAVTINAGDILVADNGSPRVIRVDPVSGAQTLVSSGGLFVAPIGLALEASGDILVTTPGTSRGVIHVNPINGAQTPVSTGGLFANPIGLAIEASGNILVSDQTTLINGAVIRVTPVGGAQTPVSTD